MIRIPPVPFAIRAAMVTPLLLVSSICLATVAWVTPEVKGRGEQGATS